MQSFYNSSSITRFIQNLVHNVPIPICNTVTVGDFIVEGQDYVFETNFIRCTKSGYLGGKMTFTTEYDINYGKNRLFNQYLPMTTMPISINIYDEQVTPTTPFAVLNLSTKKLSYYYAAYKITGDEFYDPENPEDDEPQVTPGEPFNIYFEHQGLPIPSEPYSALDDPRALCNAIRKGDLDDIKTYPTICYFVESEDESVGVMLANCAELDPEHIHDLHSLYDWFQTHDVYYSYPLATPIESSTLTDEEIASILGITEDNITVAYPDAEIITFNYPSYNVSYAVDGVPVNIMSSSVENVSNPYTFTTNGVSCTVNTDGTINLVGDSTEDTLIVINPNFNTTEFKNFLISGLSEDAMQNGISFKLTDASFNVLQIVDINNRLVRDFGVCSFCLFIPSGVSCDNILIEPMVRDSSYTSDEYAPYQEPEYSVVGVTENIVDKATYFNLKPYEYGKIYNKETQNFISNSEYYDENLHNYFANFLRCLRNVKGIDLLPFFNLNTDNYLSNYRITNEGLESYYNNLFKILKVPIKFNTTYTIAMDCSSEVRMCPALFNGNIPLIFKQDSGRDLSLTDRLNASGNYVRYYSSMNFKEPITYRVENTDTTATYGCKYFSQYEKDLVLLIQLPINHVSTITILEGDYTNTNSLHIINVEEAYKLHQTELNKQFCSNLSLMQFSTKSQYTFSDRMVEYLLWNVICPLDEIYNNVQFVQNLIPLNFRSFTPGVWNNYIRSQVYKFSMTQQKSNKLDMNGFVDKDTEKLLMSQLYNV